MPSEVLQMEGDEHEDINLNVLDVCHKHVAFLSKARLNDDANES